MKRGRDWLPSDWLARHRGAFLDGPEGRFSFERVRRLVLERSAAMGAPMTIRPERTVAGVIDALAALEWGQRALLIHPRAPDRAPAAAWEPGPGDEVLFTTSGSSGRSKLVRLSRPALDAAAEAHARNLPWADGDRWLLSIPPAHIGGFSIVVRCLRAGTTVVLPDALQGGFRPEAFVADARRFRFTLASMVPTMLHRLQPSVWPEGLRAVLLGGAAAPPSLLQRFSDRPVLTTYGMTEACAQVATEPLHESRPPAHLRGVGRPLAGVDVDIEDGRIRLRGPSLMRGYLGRADAFGPGGWFETGDLGALESDGRLVIRGRSDDLIVTGGENVFPSEVEAALEGMEGVDALRVVGVADAEWGQRVAAAYVGDASLARVDAEARTRLPDFRRPTLWLRVDALPEGATGKVSRRSVEALFGKMQGPPA